MVKCSVLCRLYAPGEATPHTVAPAKPVCQKETIYVHSWAHGKIQGTTQRFEHEVFQGHDCTNQSPVRDSAARQKADEPRASPDGSTIRHGVAVPLTME
jgi:hypothetical protein